MKRLKRFFMTTILGGLGIVLPIIILLSVFKAVYLFITKNITFLSNKTAEIPWLSNLIETNSKLGITASQIISISIVILIFFFIGLMITTRIGNFIHNTLEKKILFKIPGYKLVKETVKQFTGEQENPFSAVALVDIYGSGALMTAFITERHESGGFTVFVPTGPNPTSGNIFHLNKEQVFEIKVNPEEVMRSIISCGKGSSALMKKYDEKYLSPNVERVENEK